jgi:hypothetical protein
MLLRFPGETKPAVAGLAMRHLKVLWTQTKIFMEVYENLHGFSVANAQCSTTSLDP